MNKLKSMLYRKCMEYVEQRIIRAQQALDFAKEATNDETKSSAGDKHETGRAMGHMEQEKSTRQLSGAIGLKRFLSSINPDYPNSKVVGLGSIVLTNKGNFYISIAAGEITINDTVYYAISASSPLGIKLMGLSTNQEAEINHQRYRIEKIL